MKPKDIKRYYKTGYRFNKETGMSAATLGNWLKWGYVPISSQLFVERVTDGALKADWENKDVK